MAVIKNKWVEKLKNRTLKTSPSLESDSLDIYFTKNITRKAFLKTLSGLRK